MTMNLVFILNSILLGIGLAMDAFSVSLANGLNEPKMKFGRMCLIAGVFGAFQAIMPMTGWICVHTVLSLFSSFQAVIPWIALILLAYIGGKMLIEGIRGTKDGNDGKAAALGFGALLIQGIATSIDALSVGFTIADYELSAALLCAGIIALVTFLLCLIGLLIGRKFGTKLAGKATIFGGILLMGIGIEIFISGIV